MPLTSQLITFGSFVVTTQVRLPACPPALCFVLLSAATYKHPASQATDRIP